MVETSGRTSEKRSRRVETRSGDCLLSGAESTGSSRKGMREEKAVDARIAAAREANA